MKPMTCSSCDGSPWTQTPLLLLLLPPPPPVLPLLWEPTGLLLDRHRDAGTAFILGGGLVPDTLSTLPPTYNTTAADTPLPTLLTITHRQKQPTCFYFANAVKVMATDGLGQIILKTPIFVSSLSTTERESPLTRHHGTVHHSKTSTSLRSCQRCVKKKKS